VKVTTLGSRETAICSTPVSDTGPPEDARRPDGNGLFQVHLALFFVQLLFGGFHVVGKAILAEVSPLALAGLRVGLAAPVLLAVAGWRDRCLPPLREMPRLALLGFLGVFANQLLFLIGLSHTTAANAAILMPSIPVFALALSVIFRIQRAAPRQWLGVASAVAGAVVLVDPTAFRLTDETVLGNLLILANCLSYAAFLVFQRPVLDRLPWRTFIAWSFLFGGAGVLTVSAPELVVLARSPVSPATWVGVLYIALAVTGLGYFLATWSVRRSSPTLVAAYTTLQPVLAVVLAVIFLGERPGGREAAGFLLIAAGLLGVAGRRR
jgi:drug/metabolite transporter (DMT)-like permease